MSTSGRKQGQPRLLGQRSGQEPSVGDVVEEMRHEIARLQEENACLRLEKQRPPSLGRAAERARELVSNSAEMLSDAGDEATDALVQVMVMREALASVLQDLHTSIVHFQREVVTMIPAPELDRRMADRREQTVSFELLDASRTKRRPRRPSPAQNGHTIPANR
jgi:hypothetical protein